VVEKNIGTAKLFIECCMNSEMVTDQIKSTGTPVRQVGLFGFVVAPLWVSVNPALEWRHVLRKSQSLDKAQ
jgi:hypothetical protein